MEKASKIMEEIAPTNTKTKTTLTIAMSVLDKFKLNAEHEVPPTKALYVGKGHLRHLLLPY